MVLWCFKIVLLLQLWTTEEQLRLEQLLIDFPPEPIEFRRFEKIAEALGEVICFSHVNYTWKSHHR